MKTLKIVSRVAMSFALVAGAGTLMSTTVLAADKAPTVSPAVGKPLQEAQSLLKAGKAKEAAGKAREGAAAAKSPYETYVSNEILTAACLKSQDYACATSAVDASLATGQVPAEDRAQKQKMLVQINYQTKSYAKAAEMGVQYLKERPGDGDVQVMVSQSYYLQKDYKRAADMLRGMVRSADAAGRPVKEDTLQLLMSAEYEQKNDAGVEAALEQLVQRYPKPQYTKDLISTKEKGLRGGTTKTSLDVAVIKFQAGVFTSADDYTEATQLALQDGLPGLGKKIMEKGQTAGVLGQAASKDREARLLNMVNNQVATDQKNLEKGEAEAQKQKTGDALVKYGEAYWSYGMYDKAIAATEAGIAKGVTNADDAKLRLGIAYQAAGKKQQANEAWKGITPGSVPAQLASLWKVVK
jgi:hypothetical protein